MTLTRIIYGEGDCQLIRWQLLVPQIRKPKASPDPARSLNDHQIQTADLASLANQVTPGGNAPLSLPRSAM